MGWSYLALVAVDWRGDMLATVFMLVCANELRWHNPTDTQYSFFASLSLFPGPTEEAQPENHIGDEL